MAFKVTQEEIERKFLSRPSSTIPDVEEDAPFSDPENAVPPVPAPPPELEVSLDEVRLANVPDVKVIRPDGVPNVRKVFLTRVKALGAPRVAKLTGRSIPLVKRWIEGTADPHLTDLQKFLDQPTAAEWNVNRAILRLDVEDGKGTLWADKPKLAVAVLMASNRDVPKPVMWTALAFAKNDDIQFFYADQPILVHARNELAKRFLDSANSHAIFWDDDVFPPFANPGIFRAIAQPNAMTNNQVAMNALHRLLSHQKDIVSAVYASRRKNGPLTIQPDLAPKGLPDREIADKIRANRAQGLVEVDWVATGFTMIHRRVFETILQKGIATIDRDFPTFFNSTGNEGEDFAFSMKAKKAGFKAYIDADLHVGHIGRSVYLPETSKRPES